MRRSKPFKGKFKSIERSLIVRLFCVTATNLLYIREDHAFVVKLKLPDAFCKTLLTSVTWDLQCSLVFRPFLRDWEARRSSCLTGRLSEMFFTNVEEESEADAIQKKIPVTTSI